MATITTLVECGFDGASCAGKCGGEHVAARGIGDRKVKTVRVEPCSFLRAQGWQGNVATAMTHADAAQLLTVVR